MHYPVAAQTKTGCVFDHRDPNTVVLENIPFEDTWKVRHWLILFILFVKAMEDLVTAGLAKSIGLSNFNRRQMDTILKMCRIQPTVNQVEVNLRFLNKKLIEYCHSKGVVVEGYSPFRSIGYSQRCG